MTRVLRTIAIIDAVSVAVFAVIGWLFGLTPTQTAGVVVVSSGSIALVLTWRAIVNAPPSRKARQDWQHLSADHVDRLPTPRAVAEIVAPQTTKELDHVTVHQPRISSAPVRAISAPPNHRQRGAAD